MTVTVIVTGFGPFPGAPFNPTGPLAKRLARMRRPTLANVKVVSHVFPTSYTAVDRELPTLIAEHKPDALLMFGLAPRARALRIEIRARNAVTLLPDSTGRAPQRGAIALDAPPTFAIPAPLRALLAATRDARMPATPSRDAGNYLCNYLCWRVCEITRKSKGPRLAAFIHVPPVRRGARPRGLAKARPSLDDLIRAGSFLLAASAAAARR
ncbi:MAG: pyroglutamyl-peptidase I [Pseudolabrys sp.]